MSQNTILLYYKYTRIPRPKDTLIQQRSICLELGLKGRVLIAPEGINGTVEGSREATEKYIEYMDSHQLFSGISFKKSTGDGTAFPKLVVKTRKEIVTSNLGEEDVHPAEVTGKYLSADELHHLFATGKPGEDFAIIDMRNDFELAAGMFEGSVPSGMKTFKDLKRVPENLSHLKDKMVVTVCTGGVRCEKASGYLVTKGFKNVYQLKDGIVTYMEKYPNKNFKGKLYVFDSRVLMGFKTDAPDHEIIGQCEKCLAKSENYINCYYDECHRHFICCTGCMPEGYAFCNQDCQGRWLKQSAK